MVLEKEKIERLRQIFDESQRIVIVSHTNPDGDAMGSSLSLAGVLQQQGHTVHCIVPNRFPYYMKWVPKSDEIIIHNLDKLGVADAVIADADCIVCADMSSLSRLEQLSEAIKSNTKARRVLIDHHLSPSEEFDVILSFPESSSASFVVYSLIVEMFGVEAIDATIATQLYVGIMTDTGNFAFSYLTPELFRAVAVLSETGINIPQIYNNVYNSFTEGRAKLFGYVINRKMRTINKGSVAYMSLTEEEMRRFWFQQGDSEGFVNYPLTIKKMRMSAMFTEQNGFIRVSLRSRGSVDVNEFARRYFDGGGHLNAAGGKSFVSMEETLKHFVSAVEEFHAEGKV